MKTLLHRGLRISICVIFGAIVSFSVNSETTNLATPPAMTAFTPAVPATPATGKVEEPTRFALPTTETNLVPEGIRPSNQTISPTQEPQKALPAPTPEMAATPAPSATPATATATAPTPSTSAEPVKQTADAKPATPAVHPVGRVIWVKGVFVAERADKNKRGLQKSSVIYVGDTLITDGKTQAQIAFTDTTLMTFRPDTKFLIKEYDYKPENKSKGSVGKYVMGLIEGGFRTITGLIAKGNTDDYKVVTPVATIGVRGTDYSVYLGSAKQGGQTELVLGQMQGTPFVTTPTEGTIVLNDKQKYAEVSGGKVNILPDKPAVLVMTLEVVPAIVEPFTPGEQSGLVKGADISKPGESEKGSFCIK